MNNKTISGLKCIWCLFLFCLLALPAQAVSFDCGKAQTKVEKLICGDTELSRLDEDLSKAYQQTLERSDDKQIPTDEQRQWLKQVRNACHDAGCLKHAYEARISQLNALSSAPSETSTGAVEGDLQSDQTYRFTLTKGKGIPVCDAYLKRLNTTEYDSPPYCGRPENDSVKGFALLHRVPLSPADVHDLYPIVWNFMLSANQNNLDWSDINLQRQLTQTGQGRLIGPGEKLIQMDFDRGRAKIWRYDPPIDIDNDGVPDNVEVWEGSALSTGVGGAHCGEDLTPQISTTSLRQPQIAFVISGNNDRLDVPKTEQIFAHPNEGYRFYNKVERKWVVGSRFRPIGNSIGIFKYQDLYYFDTFFDSWGDLENERQKDINIGNTLGVFLRKDGKTKQVCEYLMKDDQTQSERGNK
jgi:uncharacterized protein